MNPNPKTGDRRTPAALLVALAIVGSSACGLASAAGSVRLRR